MMPRASCRFSSCSPKDASAWAAAFKERSLTSCNNRSHEIRTQQQQQRRQPLILSFLYTGSTERHCTGHMGALSFSLSLIHKQTNKYMSTQSHRNICMHARTHTHTQTHTATNTNTNTSTKTTQSQTYTYTTIQKQMPHITTNIPTVHNKKKNTTPG